MGRRVALLIPTLAGGGAERVMLRLAGAFIQRGLTVDVVVMRKEGEYRDLVPSGVELVSLDRPNAKRSLPLLVSYLRRRRPVGVLSTLWKGNWAASLAVKLAGGGTRCVVREAVHLSTELRHLGKLHRWLVPRMLRWLYRDTARVAVSRAAARDLENILRLPEGGVKVIYNPAVVSELRSRALEPVTHEWLRNNGAPVIVAAGRLHRQKGFDVLLDAFARVRKMQEVRLVILGDGPERSSLTSLCKELGISHVVDLPGFVKNPWAYMARANLFVLSSRYEGLPNVVIEALACGTRVVSTDCPSGPRELLDGGRFGALVPPADPAALAVAMEKALVGADPVEDPSLWLRQFDLEVATDRYLELMGLSDWQD